MATLQQIYDLRYQSGTLKPRVTAAVAKAAQDVMNEPANIANHAARVAWATVALNDAPAMAERFLWGVVGNASIQTSGDASTDNDIQFVVNSLIDTFAV